MHVMMLRYGETIWSSESVTPKTGQLRKSARGAVRPGARLSALLSQNDCQLVAHFHVSSVPFGECLERARTAAD
jgi:hypothetical protein